MKFLEPFNKLPTAARIFSLSALCMMVSVCSVLWYIWEHRQDYSFGFIVPIFVLYILYDRRGKIFGYFTGKRGETDEAPRESGLIPRFFSDFFFGSMLFFGMLFYLGFAFFYFLTQNRDRKSVV